MPASNALHFDTATRAWALGLHEAFVRGVQEKLFPAFDNIEAEAEAFAEQEYERLGCRPGWEGGPDMADIAESASDRGIERYQDLVFVQGQLHALSVAGIYHLWERSLKEFLVRTLGWTGMGPEGALEIQRAGFAKLVETLTELSFAVRDQSFFDNFETVSLIANTCKHGEGPSFERLADKAPELLRGPYPVVLPTPIGVPRPDDLWINAETFAEKAHSIEQFWHAMPEHLPVPAAWYDHD